MAVDLRAIEADLVATSRDERKRVEMRSLHVTHTLQAKARAPTRLDMP